IDELVPRTSSTLTHQIWTSGAWTNSHRTITTFGPNESETEVINQNWDGTQWVNVSRHEVTVLADSQSTTQTIDQVWEADAWVNVVRTLAQNLSENQHQSQFFNWQDQWQLDSRTVITTTGDNYHSLSENYEAGDDQWIPYAQHFRVIDELDEIKTFQNFIGNWINDYRETTNWSGILQDERPSRNVVSVYPNPSADTIHVSALQTVQSYTLFGINGQLIKSGKPTNDQFSIDISTLKNGVYILSADGKILKIIKR
ncbi:MAG TPA: T9SS type A sorting domain-containing protein, partial [Flavobacterium sp.]|nr:T9SS type A sorting domain-containing protein [Flavobacterium sp.]